MENITRISISIPNKLLTDFDQTIKEIGYKSRSKAIHDTIRAFVSEQKQLSIAKGIKTGVITMVYNHEMRELEANLTNTQHHFESIINASMHIHISKNKCLETIAVKGEAKQIKHLVEKLKAKRGVEQVKLNLFSI